MIISYTYIIHFESDFPRDLNILFYTATQILILYEHANLE